jgi:hypothetical protein
MTDVTHIHGRSRAFGPHELIVTGHNAEPLAVSAANSTVGTALTRTATGIAFAPPAPGEHTHPASDINSGVLDVSRLPTGIPATSIGGGTVSDTEFGRLDGVTSAIQTQLNGKLNTAAGTTGDALTVFTSGSTTVGANWTLFRAACHTLSTVAPGGTRLAAIACVDTTVQGNTSAAIATSGTVASSAIRGLLAAASGTSTVTHETAAVIGGNNLASQADDSLTSNAVYANTTLLTCDATQKKDISDATSGEGSDTFTAKLMAVKPKQYRWKSDDEGAGKSMGFTADEVEASFPECVHRTWRKSAPLDAGGFVYSDEPLQHAVIDVTAMLSMLVKTARHLQIQLTALKAEIELLKL